MWITGRTGTRVLRPLPISACGTRHPRPRWMSTWMTSAASVKITQVTPSRTSDAPSCITSTRSFGPTIPRTMHNENNPFRCPNWTRGTPLLAQSSAVSAGITVSGPRLSVVPPSASARSEQHWRLGSPTGARRAPLTKALWDNCAAWSRASRGSPGNFPAYSSASPFTRDGSPLMRSFGPTPLPSLPC